MSVKQQSRHKWMRLEMFLATLILSLLSLALSHSLFAATCIAPDRGFLAPDTILLPANARGLPWAGFLKFRCEEGLTTDCERALEELKISITVEELLGDQAFAAPFDLVLLDQEMPAFIDASPTLRLLLVTPEGFGPGRTYRFTYRARQNALKPSIDEERKLQVQTVTATVCREEWVPGMAPSLSISPQESIEISLSTSGSGSHEVAVEQSFVEWVGADMDTWRDALLVATYVDGLHWRPQASFCQEIPFGLSWTGKGKERIFTRCIVLSETMEYPLELPPGTHTVKMVAWLPGTGISMEASGEVTLTCLSEKVLKTPSVEVEWNRH